jgi:glycosyltransferase involved in cell wall biosynthesis
VNILFIHEVNWWKKVVYEIHELPELLSQRGHDVTLIDFPEGVDRTGWRRVLDLKTDTKSRAHRAYDKGSVEIRTPGRVAKPPADRLLSSLTFVPLLIRTIRAKRPDVIVLYGVPTNGWQTVLIAKRFGIPVVFRALDVSHELRRTVFAKLIKRAEEFIYRNADLISANNPALADYCISHGAKKERVAVHFPGMDVNSLTPKPRDMALATSLGIESSDRVVMFMGTLYRFAGLDTFLTLMAPQLLRSPSTKVLLLGGGEHLEILAKLARKLNIERQVLLSGFVDYSELARYMTISDVAINTFPSSLVTDCALPSKVLQYMCCVIPTVATPVKGLLGLVPEGEGVVYRPLDKSFVDAIETLLEDDHTRDKMAKAARRFAEKEFDWETNITRFEAAFNKLAQPGSSNRRT